MSEHKQWRPGRPDMTDWNELEECWAKAIYKDDPDGKMHMGKRLPETVCIALGKTEEQAHRRARFISDLHNMNVRNPDAVKEVIEAARRVIEKADRDIMEMRGGDLGERMNQLADEIDAMDELLANLDAEGQS